MAEIGTRIRARWGGVRRVACSTARSPASRSARQPSSSPFSAAQSLGTPFEACRYAIDTLKRTVPGVEERST